MDVGIFTVELSKSGLEAIYRDWQIPIMKALFNGAKLKSLDAWKTYAPQVSRASVIIFLQSQKKAGILGGEDHTGKGGHHTVYEANTSETELMKQIHLRVEKITG